ncbi:hypothetical protein TKK_0010878 [Trichogramma kaykai]
MVKKRNLSNQERLQIIALHSLNMSNNAISKKLKLNRRTVDYNVKKFTESNSIENRHGNTRKKTSLAEDQYICNVSLRNRKMTVPEITSHVNKSLKNPVSYRTVSRRLAQAGLNARVAVKTPLLRAINKKKD